MATCMVAAVYRADSTASAYPVDHSQGVSEKRMQQGVVITASTVTSISTPVRTSSPALVVAALHQTSCDLERQHRTTQKLSQPQMWRLVADVSDAV